MGYGTSTKVLEYIFFCYVHLQVCEGVVDSEPLKQSPWPNQLETARGLISIPGPFWIDVPLIVAKSKKGKKEESEFRAPVRVRMSTHAGGSWELRLLSLLIPLNPCGQLSPCHMCLEEMVVY